MPRKTRIGSLGWDGRVGDTVLTTQSVDVTKWEAVDEMSMPEKMREHFLRRKGAVTDYIAGKSEKHLKETWGLGRSHARRMLVDRCLKTHDDGKLWGWRGVIPHKRVNPWTRQTAPRPGFDGRGGNNGVLQWLFASPAHVGLEIKFRFRILEEAKGLRGTRTPKLKLFEWFIKELRESGRERRGEWPFDTERLGYSTISKYITKVLNENPEKRRKLLGGKDAERKARAGDGVDRPDFPAFGRVESDAHCLDIRVTIMVPSPHGGYEQRKVHRLWVIVLIDVATRVVLGYYLSMRRQVAAEDMLRAIQNSLSQWSRRPISFSDRAYAEKAGFPSARNPKYLGACWDEFSVDGALANICDRVESQLGRVVGAKIFKPQDPASYSSRRSLDDRPYIESFFKVLASGARGLHGLSPSTKGNPKQLKGDGDPAKMAQEVQFQLEYLEELLDVLIANYNATPHSGIGYRSPLDQLDFLCSFEDSRIRTADPSEVARLGAVRKLCTLLGGADTGRRPYFNFAHARYSSEALMQRPDLLGKKLWLTIEQPDDARFCTVTTLDGIYICTVRAAPPWHRTPHSLFVRQAIRALEVRRLIYLSSTVDAVEEFIKFNEGLRDKKLPAHPAYLKEREILATYATNRLGMSTPSDSGVVPAPQESEVLEPEQFLLATDGTEVIDIDAVILSALPQPAKAENKPSPKPSPQIERQSVEPPKPATDSKFPPRRMAKTW